MISITKNDSTLLKNKVLKIVLPIAVILLIWEVVYLVEDNTYFVPSIPETLVSLCKIVIGEGFRKTVLIALFRVLSGLLLGVILGTVLATLCHHSFLANAILAPIMSIIKATPIACIIVLLWIRMTYNQLTVFLVLLMVIPIVWQNVLEAYSSIDKDLIEVAQVFEFTYKTKLKLLVFPALLKYLIPAIITSIGLAWKAEIAAEIMTNNNIGRLIYDYKNSSYDTASIFAWTILIVMISLIFEKTAKYILRRIANDPIDKKS